MPRQLSRPQGLWQTFLCWAWAIAYKRWLDDSIEERPTKVIGWRTARVVNKWGSVKCMTPCFLWFQ